MMIGNRHLKPCRAGGLGIFYYRQDLFYEADAYKAMHSQILICQVS